MKKRRTFVTNKPTNKPTFNTSSIISNYNTQIINNLNYKTDTKISVMQRVINMMVKQIFVIYNHSIFPEK